MVTRPGTTRRATLAMMGATALTACAAPLAMPVTPDRVGDRKPVTFVGRQPDTYPVQGIDVSRFQNTVDWAKVAARGRQRFAFLKATEGGDLLDPQFRRNWAEAAQAGIPRGAYHFYYFCTDPQVQARWFIRNVPRARGALPPVLDLEWNPFSPTCTLRPPPSEVAAQVRVWMDTVTRHYGQRPIIYTTLGFYDDAGMAAFRSEEFWLRSTARRPEEAFPGQPWRFWQYTATGLMPGVAGDTDRNAFNGSEEDWQAWLARRALG